MDYQGILLQVKTLLGIDAEFTQVLLAFALLMARVLPVVILTPFLGGETVPQEVKMGFGVMLGLVLFPVIIAQVRSIPISAVLFLALMMKEIFVGLTLTMIVGMVFDSANVAGNLIDTMAGTNQAQLMVPQLGTQVSLFSKLNLQMTTVIFLTLGGHHVVIRAFGESLFTLPLDTFPKFSHGTWAFYETVIRVFGDLIRIALALASPVLLASFLTDLALGMINRVAPQVQVFFIAMQIKPGVTVLIMLTSLHLILNRLINEFQVMFRWMKQALYLLS
jgi:flagellar biosynthesis protein FliR